MGLLFFTRNMVESNSADRQSEGRQKSAAKSSKAGGRQGSGADTAAGNGQKYESDRNRGKKKIYIYTNMVRNKIFHKGVGKITKYTNRSDRNSQTGSNKKFTNWLEK